MSLNLLPKEAFVSALSAIADRPTARPVAFLVGSALSMYRANKGDPPIGVPDVDGMIDVARDLTREQNPQIAAQFEKEVASMAGAGRYQKTMDWVQAWLGQDRVNDLIERATLKACRRASDSPPQKYDPSEWNLTPGARGLARFVSGPCERYHGPILTTNFDPLLELALKEVSGEWPRRFVRAADGAIDMAEFMTEVRSVIYLHGYWRGSNTLHTPTQLRAERPLLKQSLQGLLSTHTLVVMGYGGWDDAFTAAFTDLLQFPVAKYDVLWCFYSADAAKVGSEYAALLSKVRPAIDKGYFRTYGGINCHTIFDELAPPQTTKQEQSPVPAPSAHAANTTVRIPGFELLDDDALKAKKALSRLELLQYFDGATPNVRHALSPSVPRRACVAKIVADLERARRILKPSSLTVIRGAGGEGKSTALWQVAADVVGKKGWSVLVRPEPTIWRADRVGALEKATAWLIVLDDAEDSVEVLYTAGPLLKSRRQGVHFLVAARDTDWSAAGGDAKNWNTAFATFEQYALGALSEPEADAVVGAWEALGPKCLGDLNKLPDRAARVRQFLELMRHEDGADGSFFGGLLAARLADAELRKRLSVLLERLKSPNCAVGTRDKTLFHALVYVAACHRKPHDDRGNPTGI